MPAAQAMAVWVRLCWNKLGLAGGGDVVARVGVEAGGGAGGARVGVVGARRACRLGGGAGRGDVVAGVGVEAGGLAGGWLVGAGGAGRWSGRTGR